ncbi:MAG: DUF1353 domain-containing protein [bacterium]|nr:DUF1353 domain-containing protein [bacterium]
MNYNSFDAEPMISVNPNNKEKPFVLLNDAAYLSAKYAGSEIYLIKIKQNYTWDGATIPRFLWRFVGSQYNPEFLPASMVHDWLCEHKDFISKNGVKISSDIFRDILMLYKVPVWKAKIMAAAVRCYQMTQKDWK